MSREEWFSGVRQRGNLDKVGTAFTYRYKTDDPEAKAYDEANDIYLSGIKMARCGDLAAAAPQIACAFLLDMRSINFLPKYPDEFDPAKKKYFLDYDLLKKLIEHDSQGFASIVLRIMMAECLGAASEFGQYLIAGAIESIDYLLQSIEENPDIENPDKFILGGCLKRTSLLRLRSNFHMAMGNRKQAVRDLTRALEIDEFWTPARDARASVWAATNLKDGKRIHSEYQRIIKENHKDNRANEVAYAWLALTTLDDPSLGTNDDAKEYYEKCVRAVIRRDEIYGKRQAEELPPAVKLAQERFREIPGVPNLQKLFQTLSMRQERTSKPLSDKYVCVNCGAGKNKSGGKLMKCARCKSVCYCSKECQTADWKSHKAYCKIMKDSGVKKEPPPQPNSGEKPGSKVEDMVAKEKIGYWTSNQLSAKRLQKELRDSYQSYGRGISDWWSEMEREDREKLLLDITNKSIPLKKTSDGEIREKLTRESQACALFEYNIETLCGSCSCDESCNHFSSDRLIHEMFGWASTPGEKDDENFSISLEKSKAGVFPNIHGKSFAFVTRPAKEDELMSNPYVFTELAPQIEIDRFHDYVEKGLAYDASVAHFALGRKVLALSLLVKVFDEFQRKARRQFPVNPVERLMGCGYCSGSCENESAKRCPVCKITWYCCEGCLIEDGHKTCPLNQACDNVVIFH